MVLVISLFSLNFVDGISTMEDMYILIFQCFLLSIVIGLLATKVINQCIDEK